MPTYRTHCKCHVLLYYVLYISICSVYIKLAVSVYVYYKPQLHTTVSIYYTCVLPPLYTTSSICYARIILYTWLFHYVLY